MYECPRCDNASVVIQESVSMEPQNSLSNEEILQLIQCPCDFHGMAIYKESTAGPLDRDGINHDGYELDTSSFEILSNLMKSKDKKNREELAIIWKASFQDSPVKVNWRSIFPMKLKG